MPPIHSYQWMRSAAARRLPFLKARDKIPAGNLAEIRIQDLHADPVGEVKRVYRELNLEYTPAFEARLLEYLHATRDFTPNKHYEWTPERAKAISDKLAPLVEKFRHHEPAIAKNPPPKPAGADTPVADREWMGALAALGAAAVCGAIWFWLSRMSPAAATFTDRMIVAQKHADGLWLGSTVKQSPRPWPNCLPKPASVMVEGLPPTTGEAIQSA